MSLEVMNVMGTLNINGKFNFYPHWHKARPSFVIIVLSPVPAKILDSPYRMVVIDGIIGERG